MLSGKNLHFIHSVWSSEHDAITERNYSQAYCARRNYSHYVFMLRCLSCHPSQTRLGWTESQILLELFSVKDKTWTTEYLYALVGDSRISKRYTSRWSC